MKKTIYTTLKSDESIYQKYATDAGYDIRIFDNIDIKPFQTISIQTSVRFILPKDVFGWVVGRSSLEKEGILIRNGIIDPDYTGCIHITITNLTKKVFSIHKADKIAQIIFLPRIKTSIKIVSSDEFNNKSNKKTRQTNGLGSTHRN